MFHDRRDRWLATTLVVAGLSLAAGAGCARDSDVTPPQTVRVRPPAALPPNVDPPSLMPPSTTRRATAAPTTRDDPPGCTSFINGDSLVCTTCPGDLAPECLAAECTVGGPDDTPSTCLRCADPKDRVAVDCSADFSKFAGGSLTTTPNDVFSFASCSFFYGNPMTSGTTCNYPGTSSCQLTVESPDFQCLSCGYRDGSSVGICGDLDDEDPPFDPLADRPGDLPAPGTCVTELGTDGKVACTTCTKDDLSATRSCRHPGIVACEFTFDVPGCDARCTTENATTVLLCASPRGPQPVPAPPLR
jgi:hypothetical protein